MRFHSASVPWAVLAAGLLLLSGCPQYQYDLEMVPAGAEVERSLTCTPINESKPLPLEEVERLALLYPSRASAADGKRDQFSGRFRGDLPPDLGTKGTYTYRATSLGTASVYLERFKGSDDLDVQIDKRRTAADEFTELARGFFRARLSAGAAAKVDSFLDTTFRRDLRNLGHYLALGSVPLQWFETDPPKREGLARQSEPLARLVQYVVERGYMGLDQAASVLPDLPGQVRLPVLRQVLARKAALDDDEAAELKFLTDFPAVQTAWDDYVRGTPAFARALRERQLTTKADGSAPRFSPGDFVAELQRSALGFAFAMQEWDRLNIRLKTGAEPWSTNGTWNPETKQVTWNTSSASPLVGQPVIAYAVWGRPDATFQTAHFGNVVLDQLPLAWYSFYHSGLSATDAHEWDAFLENLSPNAGVRNQVQQFDDQTKSEPLKRLVRDVILPNL